MDNADFAETFSLYLPSESVKVSETRENSGDCEVFKVSKENPSDTLENVVLASKDAPSRHFDTLKAGVRGIGREMQPSQGVISGVLE